jgi:hypothetical protein
MVWHRKAFRLIAFTLRPDPIPDYTAPVPLLLLLLYHWLL